MARQMDGWVTIGFKADKKQLENDLKQLDKDLNKYAKEREKLNVERSSNEKIVREYEEEKKRVDELNDSIAKLTIKEKELEQQHLKSGVEPISTAERDKLHALAVEMNEIANQRKELFKQLLTSSVSDENAVKEYEKAKKELEQIDIKLADINKKQEGAVSLAGEYKSQIENVNSSLRTQQQQQQAIENFSKGIQRLGSNINSTMGNLIKKTVRWGLAIFGIRSAFSLIRSSMSTLSQYDEKLANDLEYIRFSLAMALKPIVEWLINAVMKLIQIINTLIYKMTGVNLLAKATPKAFNDTTKSLKKANKEAEELRKQLTGFDEMNILDENVKSAGDAINKIPSINLSKTLSDDELNKLFEKIKKKLKEIVQSVFDNVNLDNIKQQILTAMTGAPLLENEKVQKAMLGVLDPENAIKMPKVTLDIVKAIFKFNEIVFDNLAKIFDPVTKFFQEHPIDIGLKKLDLGKKLDINQALKNLQGIFNNFPLKLDKIDTSKIVSAFSSLPTKAQQAWTAIKNVFSNVGSWFKTTFENAWKGVKNVFSTGGKIFDGIKDGIDKSFKTIVNKLIDGINTTINIPFDKLNDTLNKIHDVSILGIKPFNNLWSRNPIKVPKIPKLRTGAILNMPGKGVFHNGAIVGEAGAEGIIPLTDENAMRLLGESIGRYVTINANITNNMNGRLISRLMQQVNTEQDFIYNR